MQENMFRLRHVKLGQQSSKFAAAFKRETGMTLRVPKAIINPMCTEEFFNNKSENKAALI